MGIWSKSGIDDDSYDIDSWLEDDEDTEWCMNCQAEHKVEWEDGAEICEHCRHPMSIGDTWSTPDTARTEISASPTISRGGDIWGRSEGFTWGKEKTWWQRDSAYGGSMSGMWGGSTTYGGIYNSVDNDAYRMNKHKSALDSICKVVDPTVAHTLQFANQKNSNFYFVYLPEYGRYKLNNYKQRNYKKVKKILKKLNIPLIDIHKEVFENEENPLKLFPFELSGHYNVEGYQKVAEAIYRLTQN